MSFLKKLAKWLLILVLVVALLVLIVVWPVLGVNPFEGRQAHLWDVVSNNVDFFVRFPGARVLKSPAAKNLEEQPGWEWVGEVVADLEEQAQAIADEVNPQLPFGLKIDPKADFIDREMAVAGIWQRDFSAVRPDSFLIVARVAWYGRFLSALKRGFVRDQIPLPEGYQIEVENGLYLKVTLPDSVAADLDKVRSGIAREEPNVIYVGRVRDVVLISDSPQWIEAPLIGRQETLPADPWFETEFIRRSDEGESIEVFLRPNLSSALMDQHGRMENGGALGPLSKVVPRALVGDVTVQLHPKEDGYGLDIANNPQTDGFSKITKQHLVNIYEAEKVNLQVEFGENGIGRFVPRERVVAAMIVRADAQDIVGLMLDYMPEVERDLFNDLVRESGYDRGLEQLLRSELAKNLGGLHLVIIHRPKEMDNNRYLTFRPSFESITPQIGFTIISRVKEGVRPKTVTDAITSNLGFLGMEPRAKSDAPNSGPWMLANLQAELDDFTLLKPAYGAMPGGEPFVLFSSSPAHAMEVLAAANDAEQRMIAEPGVQRAIAALPAQGASLAFMARGEEIRKTLYDRVRDHAQRVLDYTSRDRKLARELKAQGVSEDEIDERVKAARDTYVATEYPRVREDYAQQLERWSSIDTFGLAATLGDGPNKQVRAGAYVTIAGGE